MTIGVLRPSFFFEALFGFSASFRLSILVLLWMLEGLPRHQGDTSKPENSFIALLLVEGFKASWVVAICFCTAHLARLVGMLWWAKINFFFASHVISSSLFLISNLLPN